MPAKPERSTSTNSISKSLAPCTAMPMCRYGAVKSKASSLTMPYVPMERAYAPQMWPGNAASPVFETAS